MFSADDPYPFDCELKDFHEQCQRTRDLIHRTLADHSVDLSIYLDAALALAEVSVRGIKLTTEVADDFRSHQLSRMEFIQRLFRLDLSLQLPCADDLTLPAQLIRRLNENRFWTGSGQPPHDMDLRESALWDLLRLNEHLHSAWENILCAFAWPKWADRVPVEMQPKTPPDLPAAFEIYFQLPADSKPGKSFANKLRDAVSWISGGEDHEIRLHELRQEIEAVRRILVVQSVVPLTNTNETVRTVVNPNEEATSTLSGGTSGELPMMLSATDLARALEQPTSRVESFLRRFRVDYPDCFVEVDNHRKREARYLYRTVDVWSALQRQLPSWRKLTDR